MHCFRRPVINYPKPKTKPRPSSGVFIPGGSAIDSSDPRKSTRKKVDLSVPRLTGRGQGNVIDMDIDGTSATCASKVNNIPRRKGAQEIKAEIDEINFRNKHYRPAHTQAVSSEAEKDRFVQICEFKGGKGLPTQVIPAAREAPFERIERMKEERRMDEVRAKHRKNPSLAGVAPSALSTMESLKMQISREVTERCNHLEDLRELGVLNRQKEAEMKADIAFRVKELNRLERLEET